MSSEATNDPGHGLSQWLSGLVPAEPFRVGPLTAIPLVHNALPGEPPLLSHEAFAQGVLEVLEKDGGTVQELVVINRGPSPVLILQGDTLIGAMQDRMVAHTVLVRAGGRVVLPVGCVEQDRWHAVSARFAGGPGQSGWRLRSDTTREKLRRRAEGQGPTIDQPRLWRRVDDELAAAGLTGGYCELVDCRRQRLERTRRSLPKTPNQVGSMVLREGELVGLEALGHPATWDAMADRVLHSILDATVEEPFDDAAPPDASRAAAWLQTLTDATLVPRAAVDLGEDLELHGPGFFGEAVWTGTQPAHLCIFAG